MPNTGAGIAEDDLQRIYSLFFRPEHAWRIDNAGHGLGLTVVSRCTDLMGASQGLSSREGRRRGNDQRRVRFAGLGPAEQVGYLVLPQPRGMAATS